MDKYVENHKRKSYRTEVQYVSVMLSFCFLLRNNDVCIVLHTFFIFFINVDNFIVSVILIRAWEVLIKIKEQRDYQKIVSLPDNY